MEHGWSLGVTSSKDWMSPAHLCQNDLDGKRQSLRRMDFRFRRYWLEPLMTCSLLARLPASVKWFDLKASDSYFSHCLVVPPSEPLVGKKNQYVSKWQCLFYIHRLPNSSSEAGCCRNHSHGPACPFSVKVDWSACTCLSRLMWKTGEVAPWQSHFNYLAFVRSWVQSPTLTHTKGQQPKWDFLLWSMEWNYLALTSVFGNVPSCVYV